MSLEAKTVSYSEALPRTTSTHNIKTVHPAPLLHHLFFLLLFTKLFPTPPLKKLVHTQAAICRGKVLRSKHTHRHSDYISNTQDKDFILILAFILLSRLSCPHASKLKIEAMQEHIHSFKTSRE